MADGETVEARLAGAAEQRGGGIADVGVHAVEDGPEGGVGLVEGGLAVGGIHPLGEGISGIEVPDPDGVDAVEAVPGNRAGHRPVASVVEQELRRKAAGLEEPGLHTPAPQRFVHEGHRRVTAHAGAEDHHVHGGDPTGVLPLLGLFPEPGTDAGADHDQIGRAHV